MLWKKPAEGSSSAGLYYMSGFDNGSYVQWTDSYPNPMKIPSTDINSSYPSLAVFKKPNDAIYFHLAYQQGASEIRYSYISFGVMVRHHRIRFLFQAAAEVILTFPLQLQSLIHHLDM